MAISTLLVSQVVSEVARVDDTLLSLLLYFCSFSFLKIH